METVVAGAPLPVMWVIVSLGAPLPAYSPAAPPFAADFGLATGKRRDGLAATLVCVGVGGIATTGDLGGGTGNSACPAVLVTSLACIMRT